MSEARMRCLAVVKGLGVPLPLELGRTLLHRQILALEHAMPGCRAVYVPVGEDPLAGWAAAKGLAVLPRFSEGFAGSFVGLAGEADVVCVASAASPFLLPESVAEGLAHVDEGADIVFFGDSRRGMAPEILLRAGAVLAVGPDSIRDGFLAAAVQANPGATVVEHVLAHARLLELLLGSLRVEDAGSAERTCDALKQHGLEPWIAATTAGFLAGEHARHADVMETVLTEFPALPGGFAPGELAGLNERLALLEYLFGSDEVDSFPVDACINLMDVCNARCVFCGYHGERPGGPATRAEDMDRLDWLAFAKSFMLHGGYGEPLLHPGFPEMVRRLRAAFPHLDISTPTNGALLDGERAQAVLENLDMLRISLNAATAETHARLMPPLSWNTVMRNVRGLTDMRARRGGGPRIGLNYVLYSHNADELIRLPALASELGVDFICVDHCEFGVSPLVDWSMSLGLDPGRSNALLAEVGEECSAQGVECYLPAPFTGGHRLVGPDFCSQPWTHLFVPHDRAIYVCCEKDLSEAGFPRFQWLEARAFREAVWNAPGLRRLRRSLSGRAWMGQCRDCRLGDRNALGRRVSIR